VQHSAGPSHWQSHGSISSRLLRKVSWVHTFQEDAPHVPLGGDLGGNAATTIVDAGIPV
jgi:hypothetical protein